MMMNPLLSVEYIQEPGWAAKEADKKTMTYVRSAAPTLIVHEGNRQDDFNLLFIF